MIVKPHSKSESLSEVRSDCKMTWATTILLFYDRITSSEIDWILRWRMFSQARQSNSKEITTYTHFLTIKQMRTRGWPEAAPRLSGQWEGT